MRLIADFARFWYDFVVGDDWRIAAVVAGSLGLGAVLVAAGFDGTVVAPLVSVLVVASFTSLMARR